MWKKYAKTGELGYFAKQEDAEVRVRSLECLNELVTDALELAPDCLAYLKKLQCEEIFRFCAIPQVMAIATLSEVYNNKKVFSGVVKIRKGVACKVFFFLCALCSLLLPFSSPPPFLTTREHHPQMILHSDNMGSLKRFFSEFTRSIRKRIPEDDPSATQFRFSSIPF